MRSMKAIAGLALTVTLFFMMPGIGVSAPATEIQGTARDTLGRPLPEVNLTLKTPDDKIAGEAKSDANGHFVFSRVAPGTYAVLGKKSGFEESTAVVTVEAGTVATATLTLNAQAALEIAVEAERLTEIRNGLSPKTGGSEYHIGQEEITELPQGANTPFNEVLLQAPGVANDSFGQVHVRGDHDNLQYRIDGVILPSAIASFGQTLDTRYFQTLDLLTGALPAQYGLKTAGVVEIQTKTTFENAGQVELWGGSHDTVQPSFEYGGAEGKFNYFVTGNSLVNDLGIENPTSSYDAIHDHTSQLRGFAYGSYLFSSTTRATLITGSYDGWFQIPNNPPGSPTWTPPNPAYLAAAGLSGFDSSLLNEKQYENNRFGIAALQSSIGSDFDFQLSVFTLQTSVNFNPDVLGDLVFNGVASDVYDSARNYGMQGDSSYRLNDCHTIRSGFYVNDENVRSDNYSFVFPVITAAPGFGPPFGIVDDEPKNGSVTYAFYLQDEWKVSPKLTVNYGLRFDELNSLVDTNQLSPRFGLVYNLSADATLHAGYARYFTPPPIEFIPAKSLKLYDNTSNAAPIDESSPILPERANYYDVGIIKKITSGFSVGVDGYYKTTKDLIDEGFFGPSLIPTVFNYERGRIQGVELTSTYKSGNFSAYGNLAITQSLGQEIVSGQFLFEPSDLDYISNHWVHTDHDQLYTGSGGVSYTWCGTQFTVDGTYGSGLRSGPDNITHVPVNKQVNLGALRKFDMPLLGHMQARVAIINVFDNINEIRSGSGIGVFAPQYGPHIGFFGGLAKFF